VTFKNGNIYDGEFENGMLHGFYLKKKFHLYRLLKERGSLHGQMESFIMGISFITG